MFYTRKSKMAAIGSYRPITFEPFAKECERIEVRNAIVVWSQGVYFIRP